MLSLVLIVHLSHALECRVHTRAVFDVGSGSTKLNVSEVEVCPDGTRLVRTLDDRTSEDVPLEAGRLPDDRIRESALVLQMQALEKLKTRARELVGPDREIEFAAAGTHAFRTAANQDEIARRFQAAGVPIVALTQAQEAEIGVRAVKPPAECAGQGLVVWDVGGGSMQLTYTSPRAEFFGLPLGAETFKRRLETELALTRDAKCPVPKSTVNPIGATNADRVVKLAEGAARAALPARLQRGPRCVVGIGGLHARAVEATIAKNWDAIRACACGPRECAHAAGQYSRTELNCLAMFLSEKDDCAPEIKGPYSSTAASSLFLVLGFMNALNVEQVRVQGLNMGHGLALDRDLLHFQSALAR